MSVHPTAFRKTPGTMSVMDRLALLALCCLLLPRMTGICAAQGSSSAPWGQSTPAAPRYYGVLGDVSRPGTYESAEDLTLQQIIQAAGGLTPSASPSIRLVKGDRGGYAIFYNPQGHDVVPPGVFVVVDPLRVPGRTVELPAASRDRSIVWLGLAGVSHRPVVVPMQPDRANLGTVLLALRQSLELAQLTRVTLPPHAAAPGVIPSPLPNGSIISVPNRILVSANLPEFPATIPVAPAGSSSVEAPSDLPPVPPNSDLTPAIPDYRSADNSATPDYAPPPTAIPQAMAPPLTSLQGRMTREVPASNIPFAATQPLPGSDVTPAQPTSVPAPSSRLGMLFRPEAAAPSATSTKTGDLPAPTAEELAEANRMPADLVGETVAAPPAPGAPSLWSLLGIGGSIVTVIGFALGTRYLLDGEERPSSDSRAGLVERTSGHEPQPRHEVRSRPKSRDTVAEEPTPVVPAKAAAEPSSITLADLLNLETPIETEAAELPHQPRLQQIQRSAPDRFRVDAAASLPVPAPHFAGAPADAAQEPTFELDTAESPRVPRPHFRSMAAVQKSSAESVETAQSTLREPSMAAGTASAETLTKGKTSVEQALARLHLGRPR